jgi:bacteriocin leader peptide (microcyclamide/patellamide family)
MDKKNLMPQASQPINRTTTAHMPDVLAELEELDEEALSQVCGGARRRTPVVKDQPRTVPSSGR